MTNSYHCVNLEGIHSWKNNVWLELKIALQMSTNRCLFVFSLSMVASICFCAFGSKNTGGLTAAESLSNKYQMFSSITQQEECFSSTYCPLSLNILLKINFSDMKQVLYPAVVGVVIVFCPSFCNPTSYLTSEVAPGVQT